VIVAVVPLNFTVLLTAVVLKFVPVMVTVAPTPPESGVKLVIVGEGIVELAVVPEEALHPDNADSKTNSIHDAKKPFILFRLLKKG
jgi:hypothetical protein